MRNAQHLAQASCTELTLRIKGYIFENFTHFSKVIKKSRISLRKVSIGNFLLNSFLAVTRVHKANVKCKCIAHFCIKFSGTNGAVKMKVG